MAMLWLLLLHSSLTAAAPAPLSIDELIQKTQNESEVAQAAQKTLKSIELEIASRDLLLGWQFNGEFTNVHDDRDQVAFAQRTEYKTFTFNLAKPFSTGTTFLLTGSHDDSTYTTPRLPNNESWEVRLTQSLWRDAFGHATAVRYEGERAELISRKAQAYYDLQNFLVSVEQAYWDLSVALKEQQIRAKNIENGKRLELWTRRRASHSAAEKSDLLQSQALVSQATLDAINAENQIEVLKTRLRQYLPNLTDIQPDDRSLEKDRAVQTMIVKDGSAEPRRLDSLSARFLAAQAEAEAKKVRDSYRPRVDAYAAYGQNGMGPDFDNAWNRATNGDHSISRVGVVLSIDLSRGLVADRVKAAELAAQARVLQAQTQNRFSQLSWTDLVRQVNLLRQRAEESSRLADLQMRKVAEERKRFQLGRSTVFQMVTYELDAATAELNKYRSLGDLRKAESQARLYTTMDKGS
jgi:outer membrane protein TolC